MFAESAVPNFCGAMAADVVLREVTGRPFARTCRVNQALVSDFAAASLAEDTNSVIF